MTTTLLKFGKGNAKLDKEIITFSLPAGWTCPGASLCMARANRATGKVTDGPIQQFRCFAASAEAAYTNVRESRWHNFDLLKGKTRDEMSALILASLPIDASIVRIHVSGDYFNLAYFGAWIDVAKAKPEIKFYGYTKSIPFWSKLESEIPANLILTASEGGKFDAQINGFKRAKVVFSEEQAAALNLAIDHDDSHAYDGNESFALLLHGTQAKGTVAAKALSALKHQGIGGYASNARGLGRGEVMTTKQKLVHTVTQYDARQSKRAGFNHYALPQYLARIDEVCADIDRGANVRDAIVAAFTGRLMNVCLKATGETKSTRDDQRCKGTWHYVPATEVQP